MTSYTDEQVLEAAQASVEEKGGDYIYSTPEGGCVYATTNEDETFSPSCLVGHIVARLNPEEFQRLAEWDRTTNGDTDAVTANDELNLGFSDKQIIALREAQERQDSGHPWGESLGKIEEELEK